jgi:hypothetical protein
MKREKKLVDKREEDNEKEEAGSDDLSGRLS